MSFSLKWLLAAFVYVALAAAAIGAVNPEAADLVWVIDALAFAYVAALAVASTGRRRAMSVGFLTLSALYVIGLYLIPDRVASVQAFAAAGYSLAYSKSKIMLWPSEQDFEPALRAANAVVTMAAGLVGCCLGALAFRRGGERESPPGNR